MKIKLFYCLLISVLFSACTSFTGYQSGRTLGKGKSEITPSINGMHVIDGSSDEDYTEYTVPSAEVYYQRGLAENIDIGIKLGLSTSFTADVKWQFHGDKTSKFAASTGLVIGSVGIGPFAGQAQIPLYLSWHKNEKRSIYLTPRYTLLFLPENEGIFHGYSSSAGLIFGKRTKFALDFSALYLKDYADLSTALAFSVGLGVKIPLGTRKK